MEFKNTFMEKITFQDEAVKNAFSFLMDSLINSEEINEFLRKEIEDDFKSRTLQKE
jgi:ribonucleotide reductase beta subunit family protein with ferritin-like domain